jgi:hypothetical protein
LLFCEEMRAIAVAVRVAVPLLTARQLADAADKLDVPALKHRRFSAAELTTPVEHHEAASKSRPTVN